MANVTLTPAAALVALAAAAPAIAGPQVAPTPASDMAGTVYTWSSMPSGSQGAPAGSPPPSYGFYRSASFSATGVWGAGGTVHLEGSNDGASWFTLSPAALTAPGLFASLGASERPKYIRPSVGGDSTTDITVTGYFAF